MTIDFPPAVEPASPTTLTVYLGPAGREDLDRVQQLLRDADPLGETLTLGAVVRAALRRTRIVLLAQLVDFRAENSPATDEYFALVSEELQSGVQRLEAARQAEASGPVEGLPVEVSRSRERGEHP